MTLERRQFMQRLSVSAAALSLPGWMQACSPREREPSSVVIEPFDAPPKSTREALERARKLGRPLLLIVVPQGPWNRKRRGELFGAYLNEADDEALVDLALCEVWCADPAEIRAEIAPGVDVGESTIALLIEPDGHAPAVIDGTPPIVDEPSESEYHVVPYENLVHARNRWLRAQLGLAIAPDEDTLERRVEANRRSLSPEQWRALGGPLDDLTPPSEVLASRAPAWVRRRAQHTSDRDARFIWRGWLTRDTVRRLCQSAPPPAHWARSLGCGTRVEGQTDTRHAVACGIGFTPSISSRFLVFYLSDTP